MRLAFSAILYLLMPALCLSATIHVPANYTTIQGAIDAAKKGDVVLVDPGTYVENIQFNKSITVQSTGGAAVTVIDGNQSSYVVFIDNLVNKFSLLDGFTITNGTYSGICITQGCWPTISNNIIKGNKSNYGGGISLGGANCCPKIVNNLITENVCNSRGGGIYCDMGGPKILDNEIVNNIADWDGGGIHCRYLNVSAEISGNTISQNTAGWDGGGIYCLEVDLFNITGNTISQNTAGWDGGGIGRWYGDGPAISDNLITGNSAVGYGGGIDGGKLITGNIITGNSAGGGGGITGGTSAVIRDNTITGNSAEDRGGGLSGHFSELTGNIVSNNTAVFGGGGLYCDWATVYIGGNVFSENLVTGNKGAEGGGLFLGSGTSATLINNLIIKNKVVGSGPSNYGSGGGLFGSFGDRALLINNTFFGNVAEGDSHSEAGGIYWNDHNSAVQMINNILWNNEAGYAKEIYMFGGDLTISYTAVEGGQDSVEIGPNGVLHWGQGMIDEEPLFLDPGGDDFRLDRLSPCINRGDNEAAPPEDFDGNSRPFMGTCDMGAFEFVGDHTFSADLFTLSESAGGLIQFNLDGSLDNFQRPYLILGSLCGTSPGMLLPGGMNFRLNMDPFTVLVYATANSPFFPGFLGVLDGAGTATAQLNTQGPIAPGFLGEVMSFSYALVSPCDFVSNPVSIEIVD